MAYYTCRIVSKDPLLVQCVKWEDKSSPSAIYRVYPDTNSCDCFATKRECKHVVLAKEITDPEFIDEAFLWQWNDRNGWIEARDIPQHEDFIDAVFTL